MSTTDSSVLCEPGIVTNSVQPAVDNCVVVRLNGGSAWTVTGTSYPTALTVAADAAVKAPSGRSGVMPVDGTETALTAGRTYRGAVTLTVA